MPRLIPDGYSVFLLKQMDQQFYSGISQYPLPQYQYKVIENNLEYLVCEYYGGDLIWYFNGNVHREHGPAIEWSNGSAVWYYRGSRLGCSSQEEFTKLIKMKAFW